MADYDRDLFDGSIERRTRFGTIIDTVSSDGTKLHQCSHCKELKTRDGFPPSFRRRARNGKLTNTWCRACLRNWRQRNSERERRRSREWVRNQRRTLEGNAKQLLANVRSRDKRKGRRCTLTIEWILHRLQMGVCEVTGVEFADLTDEVRPRIWNRPSIDRIDVSKGYTPENCRMVIWMYNQCRANWPDELVEQMAVSFLRTKGYTVTTP